MSQGGIGALHMGVFFEASRLPPMVISRLCPWGFGLVNKSILSSLWHYDTRWESLHPLEVYVLYGSAPSGGFLNWTGIIVVPMPSWAPSFWFSDIHTILFARVYVRQYSWSMSRTIAISQSGTGDFRREHDGVIVASLYERGPALVNQPAFHSCIQVS